MSNVLFRSSLCGYFEVNVERPDANDATPIKITGMVWFFLRAQRVDPCESCLATSDMYTCAMTKKVN